MENFLKNIYIFQKSPNFHIMKWLYFYRKKAYFFENIDMQKIPCSVVF